MYSASIVLTALQLSGNRVCHQFTLDSVVYSPKMHSGLFIVEATDNMHDIDYDLSATTAKDSFYGTGISHAASFS